MKTTAILLVLACLVAVCLAAPLQTTRTPKTLHGAAMLAKRMKSDTCTLGLALRCAAKLADCKDACQNFDADPSPCLTCIGDGADACCPCFQKVFGPTFPCDDDQPAASTAPSTH